MTDAQVPSPMLTRVSTGIAGLDMLTGGGFFQGGLYLVVGAPGTGKTILGNQLCFQHIAAGGRALYVTVLAESHSRMFAHLHSLSFFDLGMINDRLKYFSASSALEEQGIEGLADLLRKEMRDQHATLVVMDGLTPVGELAPSQFQFERFMQRLQITTQALGCVLVLFTQPRAELRAPTYTMVDGVLELNYQFVGSRFVREISLPKFRGSAFLEGRHSYVISTDGLVITPQLEEIYRLPERVNIDLEAVDEPVSPLGTGVEGLDSMLRGGFAQTSTTGVTGAPGTGKTLLGLHFLYAGLRSGEPGLYFGFNELPARLVTKAQRIGLPMRDALASGLAVIEWHAPIGQVLDTLGERLLVLVSQHGIRRLVIDGLSGFQAASVYPDRFPRFLNALTSELRARGVTTLISIEQAEVLGPTVRLPNVELAGIIDNTLFLRHVELNSQLYRLISIVNVRESDYDPAIREFRITNKGIEVADTFASAEAILTGVARPQSPAAAERSRRRGGSREPGDAYHSRS